MHPALVFILIYLGGGIITALDYSEEWKYQPHRLFSFLEIILFWPLFLIEKWLG